MKIKATVSLHHSEWPSSKNLQTIHAGEGVEKREFSCIVDWNVNWYSYLENGEHYGDSLKKKKKLKIETTTEHIAEKTTIQKDTCAKHC